MTERANGSKTIESDGQAGVGRVFHGHGVILSSVVVDQLNVGTDCDRPKALPVALERVEMKAGQPHIVDRDSFIQLDEDGSNLSEQVGSNPARIVFFKEPFQAPMAEV